MRHGYKTEHLECFSVTFWHTKNNARRHLTCATAGARLAAEEKNKMRTREVMAIAKRLGTDAGHSAATWCIDGDTTDETKKRILAGLNDGDPEIMDMFSLPDLSGEMADNPTPRSLAEDIGIEEDDERLDDACTAWEDAVSVSFFRQLEKECS